MNLLNSRYGRRLIAILSLGVLALSGCGRNDRSDGYGNFEATEIVVSSEASGKLIRYDVDEGLRLEKGQAVAVADTTQLALDRQQLRAQLRALVEQKPSVVAEANVYRQQRRNIQRDLDRYTRLVKEGAVPSRQLEAVQDQARVIDQQISAVDSKIPSIDSQAKAVRAQIDRLDDQITKAVVRNPARGVVLANYAEPGEVVSYGKPLYRIADTGTMFLRVWISETQLSQLNIGQKVEVLFDEERAASKRLTGAVTWISSKAEFTPRIIQTREDRVNMVYAVKVLVENPDGVLKIGMPGEIRFIAKDGK
ncbi:HlyD family efflux transporter periplasmic adaptor subunit [Chlorobaculum sp. 24CR]|uniref:HlyD family secretion protein n=1 Tax=Chlorobaculum sp. 24CR TaxID=2508878 RepID=UPI00100BD596|nr:HlyD family efflux transporter periplasmic adaptor subunit [Chlorobaculum sp. 24CR]RXK80657.1 HlyD family efflux transporter periplasmic adaptor subunit [Chlorobaculum sp. 24CR]